MLTKDTFLLGMTALAGAFGREIEGPVQRLYYAVLRDRLTDAEFEQAIERVCAHETFWPAPATLIAAVHGTAAAQAEAAFAHVQRTLRDAGGFRFLPHEQFCAAFDAPTRAAIAAVGGLHEFGNVTDSQFAGFVKRFRDGYAAAVTGSGAPQLASGDAAPARRLASGPEPVAALVADYKARAAGEADR